MQRETVYACSRMIEPTRGNLASVVSEAAMILGLPSCDPAQVQIRPATFLNAIGGSAAYDPINRVFLFLHG